MRILSQLINAIMYMYLLLCFPTGRTTRKPDIGCNLKFLSLHLAQFLVGLACAYQVNIGPNIIMILSIAGTDFLVLCYS